MKSLFLLVAFVACSSATQTNVVQELKPFVTQWITESFIQKLIQPRDPVLPPMDDPWLIGNLDYDFAKLNDDAVTGNLSFIAAQVLGLSTVVDDLVIKTPILQPIRVTFNVSADFIAFNADHYAMAILFNYTDYISMTGRGTVSLNISAPFIALGVSIVPNLITNKIVVTIVDLDLGFAGWRIRAEDFMVNDQLVDWTWLDTEAVPLFEWIWGNAKVDVEAEVKDALNAMLKDCTITEIIGGDVSCVVLPVIPTRAPPILPTTIQPDPPFCPPTGIEWFPFPGNCSLYIVCIQGTQIVESCYVGLLFDKFEKKCKVAADAICDEEDPPPTTTENPEFACPPTGYEKFPHKSNCSLFNMCFDGNLYVEECAFNTYFDADPVVINCNLAHQAVCHSECPKEGVQYHPIRQSKCQWYKICFNGESANVQCADKTIYSPVEERCVTPDVYTCPY